MALAGQNAWHICTGEAAPRISGKYLPSQLRTQNAGPEPPATPRSGTGAGGCGPLVGSAKALACGGASWRCCLLPPKKKSNRPSAEAGSGATANGITTMAAASHMRRRRRAIKNSLRNAYSTPRNTRTREQLRQSGTRFSRGFTLSADGKRAVCERENLRKRSTLRHGRMQRRRNTRTCAQLARKDVDRSGAIGVEDACTRGERCAASGTRDLTKTRPPCRASGTAGPPP